MRRTHFVVLFCTQGCATHVALDAPQPAVGSPGTSYTAQMIPKRPYGVRVSNWTCTEDTIQVVDDGMWFSIRATGPTSDPKAGCSVEFDDGSSRRVVVTSRMPSPDPNTEAMRAIEDQFVACARAETGTIRYEVLVDKLGTWDARLVEPSVPCHVVLSPPLGFVGGPFVYARHIKPGA